MVICLVGKVVQKSAYYHGEKVSGYQGQPSRHATTRIIPVTCALVWGTPPNYRLIKMAAVKAKSVLSPAKAQRMNIELEILGNAGLKIGSMTH